MFGLAGLFVGTIVGCAFGQRARYEAGFTKGVKEAWSEIKTGYTAFGGAHVAVPLYEGGEPCSLLYIEQNTKVGENRHMTVRKVGCGAHNELEPGLCMTEKSGIAFGQKADYAADLLRSLDPPPEPPPASPFERRDQ